MTWTLWNCKHWATRWAEHQAFSLGFMFVLAKLPYNVCLVRAASFLRELPGSLLPVHCFSELWNAGPSFSRCLPPPWLWVTRMVMRSWHGLWLWPSTGMPGLEKQGTEISSLCEADRNAGARDHVPSCTSILFDFLSFSPFLFMHSSYDSHDHLQMCPVPLCIEPSLLSTGPLARVSQPLKTRQIAPEEPC